MPYMVAKGLATCGDVLKLFGWVNAPLTSFRLNNIMTEYVFDLTPIMEISAPLPFTIKEGITRSIEWMRKMKIIK